MASVLPPNYTDAERTALLVYDMQRGIARQIADSQRIIGACRAGIAAGRSAGMRIAYSKHMSLPQAWLGSTQLRTAGGREELLFAWLGIGGDCTGASTAG